MDAQEQSIKIEGWSKQLDEERSVFVAQHEGDFYFSFENNGEKTKIRLSREATHAMISMVIDIEQAA